MIELSADVVVIGEFALLYRPLTGLTGFSLLLRCLQRSTFAGVQIEEEYRQ